MSHQLEAVEAWVAQSVEEEEDETVVYQLEVGEGEEEVGGLEEASMEVY